MSLFCTFVENHTNMGNDLTKRGLEVEQAIEKGDLDVLKAALDASRDLTRVQELKDLAADGLLFFH